jgi:RimJ/RimL family protein N-acetyltransferase
MTVPGIQGPRVRLVPFEREYIDHVLRWFNDAEVTRYTQRAMPLFRLAEEKFVDRMAESKDDVVWAVLDENESPIGVSGIHRIDWINRNAGTGTVLGERSVWGKGYGSEIWRRAHPVGVRGVGAPPPAERVLRREHGQPPLSREDRVR